MEKKQHDYVGYIPFPKDPFDDEEEEEKGRTLRDVLCDVLYDPLGVIFVLIFGIVFGYLLWSYVS